MILYRIPLPTYVVLSILTVITMGFTNLSLEYLNYPTQVSLDFFFFPHLFYHFFFCYMLGHFQIMQAHTSINWWNHDTRYIYINKIIQKNLNYILCLLIFKIIQIKGKKYGTKDFIAAAIMCIGLIWFTLVDVTISPIFNPIGIIIF